MLDRAKLVSLRFSAHRAIGLARASDRLEVLAPVVELLDRILRQDGQQSSITNEGYVLLLEDGLMVDVTQEFICDIERLPVSSNSQKSRISIKQCHFSLKQ